MTLKSLIEYESDAWQKPFGPKPECRPPLARAGVKPWVDYLPIGVFREDTRPFFQGKKSAQVFLSSGTTSTTRSHSSFSEAGAAVYRAAALSTFDAVLREVFAEDMPRARGVSLIPTVAAWPDSSLAQMLHWFSEVYPVAYASEKDFPETLAALGGGSPLWIFATAYQLVALFDAGWHRHLPAHSVVFETGGTKTQTRAVTRAELYRMIAAGFGIPETAIVSEYGMCELASQAYDWVPRGQTDAARRLRFPRWVDVGVADGLTAINPSGRGCLVVRDAARVDFPWALRTDDLVALTANGDFSLLGRVEAAPLKGCSLRAAALRSPVPQTLLAADYTPQVLWAIDEAAISWRGEILAQGFAKFCADERICQLLGDEVGALPAAKKSLADACRALPPNAAAWVSAVRAALGAGKTDVFTSCPQRWLFIAPGNHALAAFYPLALAYGAGLQMTLRCPESFADADSVLQEFVRMLQALPGARLNLLAPELRHSSEWQRDFQAVLCFGSDATVAELRRAAGIHVQGFGEAVAVSVTDNIAGDAAAIIADAFALAQNGCMSSRQLLVLSTTAPATADVYRLLNQAFSNFWQQDLDFRQRAALDLTALDCARSRRLYNEERQPAQLLITYDEHEAPIAQVPFHLPVVWRCGALTTDLLAAIKAVLEKNPALRYVYLPADFILHNADFVARLQAQLPHIFLRKSGDAGRQSWNGLHEGLPLFWSGRDKSAGMARAASLHSEKINYSYT